MIRVVLIVAALLMASSAAARVPPDQLAQVGVRSRPGEQLPLDARFLDAQGRPTTLGQAEAGRPSVLVFADYRCNSVCGPALAIAAAGLLGSGLSARDYRLLVIGLRPNEPLADARAFQSAHLTAAPEVVSAARFLIGGADAIRASAQAAGYRYAYDRENDQFVHPVAAFVLTPQGRLSRAFPEVAVAGPELRDALVQARQGRGPSLIEIIRVLCHGIDPTTGIYNGAVQTGLRLGAVATLAALAGGVTMLARRRRAAS